MSAAKHANFLQVNRQVEELNSPAGAEIMPSPQAYQEHPWTRELFGERPPGGYFIHVKENLDHPLNTCLAISMSEVIQQTSNLVIIEEDVIAVAYGTCCVLGEGLAGRHVGNSQVFLRQNSQLELSHIHNWDPNDRVEFAIRFSLAKGAKLNHSYRCLKEPQELKSFVDTYLAAGARANYEVAVMSRSGQAELEDRVFIEGQDARSTTRIRLVAKGNARLVSHSQMTARSPGTGHLDCLGLLIDDKSAIVTVPKLVNEDKQATLTHEASVGQISSEVLNYLRSRGLNKDEAIDLIISGFLKRNDPGLVLNELAEDGRRM